MPTWALQLRCTELAALAALWHVPGVTAARHGNDVWLRGEEPDDAVRRLLPTIPCTGRYDILPDGALLVPGRRVPLGHLPQVAWQPLKSYLTVTLPPSSLPARQHARVEIRLVPSARISEPDVLLTDLEVWAQYVNSAPRIRLRGCQFAVSGDGRVLVQGTPLPPIAGTRAVARSGLVVPSGWGWVPAVEAPVLARAWGLVSGDLWLLWPGRPIERVPGDQLVAASRSAVQQTWEAMHVGPH